MTAFILACSGRDKTGAMDGPAYAPVNNRLSGGCPGPGSVSGPFGEALAGEWTSYADTRQRMLLHFSHYYQYTKNKQNIFWVDIHGKY